MKSQAYLENPQEHISTLQESIFALHELHKSRSPTYRSISKNLYREVDLASPLNEYPYIPVSLFKSTRLLSVPVEDIYREVRSSGTSGMPSVVPLDKDTSRAQSAALVEIMKHWLGPSRRPMLIVDIPPSRSGSLPQSASSAASSAMQLLGRDYFWLLDRDGQVQIEQLEDWLSSHRLEKPVVFGFTFMVWQHLYVDQRVRYSGLDLSSATVIHGGGWKKLQDLSVTNGEFRKALHDTHKISDIRDYYGSAEQLGSVWVEGSDGVLIPSRFSSALIRDPLTLDPLKPGEEGLIQSFSTLPKSYPGHSILTEDIGVIVENEFFPKIYGPLGLRVIGRLPKSEPRGCSDTGSPDAA